MVRSTLFRGVFQPKSGSTNESSRNCMRALEFYISNVVESEYPNDFIIYARLGVAKIQMFDEMSDCFDTFHQFPQGNWTNRSLPIRYSESPCSNLYTRVSFVSRSLARACSKGVVLSILGGAFEIFKSTENLKSELISKGWELPKTHWTSPLGPLESGVRGVF